jgi:hypothetical protein
MSGFLGMGNKIMLKIKICYGQNRNSRIRPLRESVILLIAGESKPVVPQQNMLPTQQTKKFHKNKTKNTVLKNYRYLIINLIQDNFLSSFSSPPLGVMKRISISILFMLFFLVTNCTLSEETDIKKYNLFVIERLKIV